MALQQAQLASLPSMNLARYIPSHTYIEPAWHKALSAFLTGAAGTTGQDLAKNAFSPDYTNRAVAAGVAPAGSKSPSFLSKTVGGPNWTEQGVDAASKLKEETTRDKMMDEKYAAQLGLSKQQLDSLNKSREDQLAQRAEDQGNRSADRQDALQEKSWEHDDNMEAKKTQADRLSADDIERKRVDDAIIAERTASAGKATAETDPKFAGQKQAAAMMTMMQAMGIDPGTLGRAGAKPSAATQSPVQPSNNSDSLDLSKLIGGAGAPSPMNAQSVAPSPNQVTQPVGGAPDPLSVREAQNAGTTATQPGQSGQSTPTPPQNPYLENFLRGQSAAPGPYNVSPPQGAPGAQPSTQFDPDMLKRAALFAQMLGSQGGIPGQGGMPNV